MAHKTREILNDYLKHDKEYKAYIKQFFNIAWSNQVTSKRVGILTKADIAIIKKMRATVDRSHNAWLKAIGALPNKLK